MRKDSQTLNAFYWIFGLVAVFLEWHAYSQNDPDVFWAAACFAGLSFCLWIYTLSTDSEDDS